MATQPPVRPITKEQQLVLQNEMLSRQLQQLFDMRANSTRLLLGDFMDGIAFTLQAAESPEEELSVPAKRDLTNLKLLLEKIVAGDWTLPGTATGRIVIPR